MLLFLFLSSRVLLKKSGCKIPRIELEDIGPSLDLVMRRTHLASDDLYKLSLKQPKALKVNTLGSCASFVLGTWFGGLLVMIIQADAWLLTTATATLCSEILMMFFPYSLRRKRTSPMMCLVQLMVESTCRNKILVNCRQEKWRG